MKKAKTGKNQRSKKAFSAFSKKSRIKAKSHAKSMGRHTARRGETHSKKQNTAAKANIEPALDMLIDGVLRKIKSGRGAARWYVIPTSRRYDFDIAVSSPSSAGEGELVQIRLAKLPRGESAAVGKITKVFGAADTREANYEQILASYGIESAFSLTVEAEAEAASRQKLCPDGREDLRGECIFTIDGADAKDLDDAISLSVTEDGYTLGVHIADVSHYVREDSELDREAMRRGTSVYFTDKVVPMLPKALSNGACSLGAGEDKYALSCFITLDRAGKLVSARVAKSIIRSCVRGVYSEVNDLLAHGTESEYFKKYSEVYQTLRKMEELYRLREGIAFGRGYVELESAEAVILLGEDGMPVDIVRRERGVSERIIEQFMLCANEAVALYMSSRKMPCVYRIHEVPDEEKTRDLVNFLHNHGIDTTPLTAGGISAMAYSKILAQAKEMGIADIVSDSMLRSFMKARYSEIRSQHFGLALDYYAHFTSPIRRYPDLAVHRILSDALTSPAAKTAKYAIFAREAAIRSSENELRALGAERAIEDLYKTLYMKKFEGEIFDARVSSVQSFGFFAVLDNTCEGLVPVSALDGYFTYSEDMGTLSSRHMSFSAGEHVRIRVKYADPVRRKVEFEFVEKITSDPDTHPCDSDTRA